MNHYYDTDRAATRCGEYEGETAFHVSANDRVSCPDCLDTLTKDERAGQWYDRLDDDEPADTRNHTVRDQLADLLRDLGAIYQNGGTYTDAADALLASDAIAAVRAAAWDEGWNIAVDSNGYPGDTNPYRADTGAKDICWCDGPDCGQTPCVEEQPR